MKKAVIVSKGRGKSLSYSLTIRQIGITYADSEDKDDVLEASAIDVGNMRGFLTKYGYELRILTDDVNDSSPDKRYPTDLEIVRPTGNQITQD